MGEEDEVLEPPAKPKKRKTDPAEEKIEGAPQEGEPALSTPVTANEQEKDGAELTKPARPLTMPAPIASPAPPARNGTAGITRFSRSRR
jgi:hypothetical protein